MNKAAIIIITLIIVVGLAGCIAIKPPATSTPPPNSTPQPSPTAVGSVPQPRVRENLAPGEHDVALYICVSLMRARLTDLASSEDAFDYVESFFTHLTTCLSANGDSTGTINDQERYIQCPGNAWHLVIYGMIPTSEITEMQIDDTVVPMMKYDVPDNWSRAVWLIYTDGTVESYYNEYDKSDAAFKVEQDISKLNNGIELDFDWRH